MAVLSQQFKDALATLEPAADATHAATAHDEVRDRLDQDTQLINWGLHTLLIGSYAREVSIRRVKDVDVFCKLPDLPRSYDPQDLLQKFSDVLHDTYGDRVAKNDRSVKVEFPAFDMHVDVVPARPLGEVWQIPDRQGGWERTHPLRFGELTTQRNKDHDGHYVPTVKLLRQTRRALLADAKPGGLFVEWPPTTLSPASPPEPTRPDRPPATTPRRSRRWLRSCRLTPMARRTSSTRPFLGRNFMCARPTKN